MTTHFFSKYLNPHFYLYHHRTKDETLTNHLLFPSFLERLEQTELGLSPPQRLPLGIPIKIAIIEKIERAPRTMGRGKRREPLFFHSPSHRAPRRRLRGTGIYFWHGWIAKSEMEDLENKKALCRNCEKWLIYIIVTSTFYRSYAITLMVSICFSIQFYFIIHTLYDIYIIYSKVGIH